jgi:hypothetical protein
MHAHTGVLQTETHAHERSDTQNVTCVVLEMLLYTNFGPKPAEKVNQIRPQTFPFTSPPIQ